MIKGGSYKVCIFIIFFVNNILLSQSFNLGTPEVINFSPDTYNAGPQNWDIKTSSNGLVYAANNDGLLFFNGDKWKIFKQPNKTIARSLDIDDKGTIIVGGQDELGTFVPDKSGKLLYKNLLENIPSEFSALADIWKTLYINENIYIRTDYGIYSIDIKNNLTEEVTPNPSFISKSENKLIYSNQTESIFCLDKDNSIEITKTTESSNKDIIEVIGTKNKKMYFLGLSGNIQVFQNQELSKWKNNAQSYLNKHEILSGLLLKNGNLAIGTRTGGLLIIDPSGQTLYKLDKKNGLQNNTINAISEDNWGNLWLASYYGIDRVMLSNKTKYFYPDGGLEGAIYDIEYWNNYWWFGSVNGLYCIEHKDYYNPFYDKDFQLVANTKGQVWALDVIDNRLYLAHHEGAFEIKQNKIAEKIGNFGGAWKFIALDLNTIAVGTYQGIFLFEKIKNKWVLKTKLKDFQESSRILIKDSNDDLWMSHPYRGIFKISFDNGFDNYEIVQYSNTQGYETDKQNYIFKLFDLPYIINENGIFKYLEKNNSFIKDTLLSSKIKGAGELRRFIPNGTDIWYISQNQTGLIRVDDRGLNRSINVINFPYLKGLYVGGYENLYPINAKQQFICTPKGVLFHNNEYSQSTKNLKSYVASLKLTKNDSMVISEHFTNQDNIVLKSNENAIELSFRVNGKLNDELYGYSYMLKGIDDKWSDYQIKSSKEYNNLKYGDYEFLLKACDIEGNISEVSSLKFTISTPWYQSFIAKMFYFIILILALIMMLLIPQRNFNKTKVLLENKQKETEKEVEYIKKQKLEDEIKHKNQELASSTLHLLQKNQTLSNIRQGIEALRKKTNDPKLKTELRNIYKMLQSDLRLEDDWDRFSIHFDQVHQDFIRRLKSQYPELSPNDHKLCAYLKMNLSSKEIAPLLNISVRGVEISRYRLRKKLKLETSVKLNDFMSNF